MRTKRDIDVGPRSSRQEVRERMRCRWRRRSRAIAIARSCGARRGYIVTVTEYPCVWCGRRIVVRGGAGRPRRFCRQSCRQRDYEARRRSAELGLSEGELVITREELESVRDRLYVLESAVKDVEADLAERGDDPEDRQHAYDWLLDAAKQAVVPSPS